MMAGRVRCPGARLHETRLRRPTRRILSTVAVLVPALALHAAACFSERTAGVAEPVADCEVPLDAARRGDALVLIRGFTFMPDTVRVRAGRSVTWVNCEEGSAEPHTTTGAANEWASPLLARGAFHTATFDASGVYDYLCSPHPFMRGVVVVE